MNALRHKTRAEQRLEWIESLSRPLTNDESEMLRRSLHAVYCRNRVRSIEAQAARPILEQHRREELATLARIEGELRG
jgi:hypothetical protein